MPNSLLLGIWRLMVALPAPLWRQEVARQARANVAALGLMSDEHHRVRDFAVRELPRAGKPLAPMAIAAAVGLPVARVRALLDELETHMTFLFRNEAVEVTWAYPVTVERTPHRVTFSTGEQVYVV